MYKIALIISIFIFTSCAKKDISINEKLINPSWVDKPNMQKNICSIGASSSENKALEKAFLKAKANISKKISVYIKTNTELNMMCTNDECIKTFKKKSQHESAQMLLKVKLQNKYLDKNENRYYVRACTKKIEDKFYYIEAKSKNKYETTKIVCLKQSDKTNFSIKQINKILLRKAKQKSVNELYGEFFYSKTNFDNGKLKSNSIIKKALGTVRNKVKPIYFQGEEDGELCVKTTSSITKEDIMKFAPTKVSLKNFCYTNEEIEFNKFKEEAKNEAYKQLVLQAKPSLHIAILNQTTS